MTDEINDTLDEQSELESPEPEQNAEPGGSKPKQKRVKARRAAAQLQATLDAYDDILASTTLKEGKRADLLIEKTHTLLQLCQLKQAEDADESLKENSALKQQHTEDESTINQLRAEVASLKASQRPVEIRTVPDPDAAIILAASLAKNNLIQNAGQVVKQVVSDPDRLKVAALLVKRSGRLSQPFVSEIADFASVYAASQRSDDELQDVISQAAPGAFGSNIQLSKAILAARGVAVIGPRSTKPVYRDVFDELDGK